MDRVTLKDVAREAGVHYSTASLALSNSPKLPKSTRTGIQSIAQRLGYRPDAALSALNAYRRVKQNVTFQATLAILTDQPRPDGWRKYFTGAENFVGMQEQAARLGYQLEEFTVGHGEADRRRLTRILNARNITGIITTPMQASHTRLDLDWDVYSAISLGFSLDYPILHRVASAHLRNTERCMKHLHSLGYRRVGFAMLKDVHERVAGLYGAGYDIVVRAHPEMTRIPFFTPANYEKDYTARAIAAWIKKHKIEAILTSHQGDMTTILPSMGIRVPEDIGLINVAAAGLATNETGIHENNALLGATAVKLLVGMLTHDERGIPTTPIQTLVDGEWVEGRTLPNPSKQAPPYSKV
jgi:LacI family transcriptional regulator